MKKRENCSRNCKYKMMLTKTKLTMTLIKIHWKAKPISYQLEKLKKYQFKLYQLKKIDRPQIVLKVLVKIR